MTRRRVALLLLPVLALIAAACGGDDGGGGGEGARGREAQIDPGLCPADALEEASADGPVEIDFWHAMSAVNGDVLNGLVRQYNQSQDRVHVNATFKGTYDESLDAYLTALRSGDLPNLVQLEETVLQTMIDSGSTVPAQACIEATDYDTSDLLPSVLGEFTVEDNLWPMPFNVSNPVFYYDRNDFEAAGLDPDQPPATLDEMLTDAQAIVDAGAADKAMSVEIQPWYPEQWSSMADQSLVNNTNGRDDRATEATLDNETMVGVFQWLRDMVDDNLVFNVGRNPSGADHLLAIASGDAAFTIGTSAALGGIYDALGTGEVSATGVSLGVAPMPGPVAGGPTSAGGAALWIVANGASDAEIAGTWDFLTWLAQPEQQATWHTGTGYIPISFAAADDPAVQQLWSERPGFQVAYEQLADDNLPPGGGGPVIGAYVEFRDLLENAMEDIILNDADPQDVATQLQADVTDAIESYNERVGG